MVAKGCNFNPKRKNGDIDKTKILDSRGLSFGYMYGPSILASINIFGSICNGDHIQSNP